jgi:mono/diheme cytochrome c family protein
MLQVMRSQGIAVPQLDAGQMADLVAFLSAVQYFRSPGSAAAGRALIETRGCLSCHSLAGRGAGAKTGGDLAKARGLDSPAAVSAAMWNHGRLAPATAAGLARWPRLGASEMTDIAAYFMSRGGAR